MERSHRQPSMARQCKLLSISRSSVYYRPKPPPRGNLEPMAAMDRPYQAVPYFGSRRMVAWLEARGHCISRKRVRRLMRMRGWRPSTKGPGRHGTRRRHPDTRICSGAWQSPRRTTCGRRTSPTSPWPAGSSTWSWSWTGTARCVLAWGLSNTLDSAFCTDALDEALSKGTPEIFNTDQARQLTGEALTGLLKERGSQISATTGRGATPTTSSWSGSGAA